MTTYPAFVLLIVAWSASAAVPQPEPVLPGSPFSPPDRPTAPGAPLIYENSRDAGPDETFLIIGENLTTDLFAWGVSADNVGGREWIPRVQFLSNGVLAATLPDRASDGPFLVWGGNANGWSEPLVLNAPQPWWCGPDIAAPGETVRVFGRNLARRPDFRRAFLYLAQANRNGTWVEVVKAAKYEVAFRVPPDAAPGDYQLWVYAGNGGQWGWGGPLSLSVKPAEKKPSGIKYLSSPSADDIVLKSSASGADIQQAMDILAVRGGGNVVLPAGTFDFTGTLRIPAGVGLSGAGQNDTTLQLLHDPNARFARFSGDAWSQAPRRIHRPGDAMEYSLDLPKSGQWTVWLRYATEMSRWNQAGVSGNMTLAVDDATPVSLQNLPNTGSFSTFKWSKAATLQLHEGRRMLTWQNVRGGGISLDALLFALDPAFTPSMHPPPTNSPTVVVVQGEDVDRFATQEGILPGGDRAAVWLSGDGARLADLTVLGTAQVNYGIAIRSSEPLDWIRDVQVERVRVADIDGKQGENCGVHVRRANRARVADCELWGRAPLFLSGAVKSEFLRNRLVPVTRFGGNSDGAILGRNETIEECIIEDNRIAAPPGAQAGGPTARRLLWFSTGHGSITKNWIAGNGVELANGLGAETGAGQARFGGVAGTGQNVGEMILFEANHRTAYFGPLADADAQSVTLPKTIPLTPDDRLGNVKREQLAHDASGNETPFWPPDVDDGSDEPPISEYYVSVFAGRGQGQTRRVLKREGERLLLERPWTVPPREGSLVTVATAFYRNHIVGNYASDGMTGIQLWISSIENIVAGNTIARQRKPGIFLYANGTTLASSMPRTWNRGLSPLFWNVIEGNRTEECSTGALVTSGERGVPIEFPRALGNVLRHNSFIRNRSNGVMIRLHKPNARSGDTAPAIAGTIVEFNVVRDALMGYQAAQGSDATVFRRNHAYFWYPVSNSTNAPVAFQVDNEATTTVIEQNSIEGINGAHDGRSIDLKVGGEVRRLSQ